MFSLLLPKERRWAKKGANEPGDSGRARSVSSEGEPVAVSQLSSECLLPFEAGTLVRASDLGATRAGGGAAPTVPSAAES